MNYKFTLSYLGTRYHGWQRQLNAVTIQSTLEDTLSRLTGEKVHLIGCGRTDAGVPARNYVANGMVNTSIPEDKLPLALNANLPEDIANGSLYFCSPEADRVTGVLLNIDGGWASGYCRG